MNEWYTSDEADAIIEKYEPLIVGRTYNFHEMQRKIIGLEKKNSENGYSVWTVADQPISERLENVLGYFLLNP